MKSSQLDDFCSANNRLQDDSKGVVATGGTARMTLNAPSYPTASQTDHKGFSPTGFSGGPVTITKATKLWMSGVTMLVLVGL